eukprot:437777-Alexandrium_andersonii.AAC.1
MARSRSEGSPVRSSCASSVVWLMARPATSLSPRSLDAAARLRPRWYRRSDWTNGGPPWSSPPSVPAASWLDGRAWASRQGAARWTGAPAKGDGREP